MAVDYASQTVLITGASSGIGRSLATALAARGSSLVLVARRADRLESLAAELRAAHRVQVTAIPFDLAAPGAGTELRDAAASRGVTVTSLVNNAGFGTFGQFTDEDPARLAQEIAVDVSAPVQLCHAFLPQLVAAGTGFLVNVASMAAYTPTPRMAVYGAAKAFVLSFTESLWAELRGTGLIVFALSPGATSTEFNGVVGTDNATAGARMRTPDDVAATALAHLDRRNPGPSVIDGQANRTSATVIRLAPRRMTAAMMERVTDPSRRANLPARPDREVRSSQVRCIPATCAPPPWAVRRWSAHVVTIPDQPVNSQEQLAWLLRCLKCMAVRRVVGISALGRGTPAAGHAGLVTASLAMDDLIAASGVSYRALIMPSFMENLLNQVQAIKTQGMFFLPVAGDRKLPSCATRDVVAVAARLLLDDSWSGVGSVPVLGPEDLSFNDMAQIMSEVLGTPVRYQQIPAEALVARLTGFGMSDAMAQAMADMMTAKNEGLDNAEPRTPEDTTPTTFRQWCEEVLRPTVLA
jgi:short-subunit dehydrogenase